MSKSFTMRFYEECAEEAATRPNGSYTILYDDGEDDLSLLTVYPGTDYNPCYAGFGGALFTFKTPDGKVILSNNCWHRGKYSDIPKSLRGKFEIWSKASEADIAAYEEACWIEEVSKRYPT